MQWKKLGLVYKSEKQAQQGTWNSSHGMIPTPLAMGNGVVRVFTTFCDESGISRPGYVDLDENNLTNVIKVSHAPLLDIGVDGTFDENGVLTCSVVRVNDELYMYYAGFELGTKVRYRLLTGLAISRDGGESFERVQKTPVLERSSKELHFRCGPFVLYENNKFRMWYVGGSDWVTVNGKPMPVYNIRYIESDDGINWPDEGEVVLDISDEDEHGFGRPYVLFDENKKCYKMYYSVRKKSFHAYRLGYAESKDGINWERKDAELNLDVSETGFDCDAIMYTAHLKIKEKNYLLYNGNDFGLDGFALAEKLDV